MCGRLSKVLLADCDPHTCRAGDRSHCDPGWVGIHVCRCPGRAHGKPWTGRGMSRPVRSLQLPLQGPGSPPVPAGGATGQCHWPFHTARVHGGFLFAASELADPAARAGGLLACFISALPTGRQSSLRLTAMGHGAPALPSGPSSVARCHSGWHDTGSGRWPALTARTERQCPHSGCSRSGCWLSAACARAAGPTTGPL